LLLPCHTFPEDIRTHAEPGSILKKKDGTKMTEEILEEEKFEVVLTMPDGEKVILYAL